MQNSPNLLKKKHSSKQPLTQQYTRLTNIAYYQADFWLMLLSSFVASFAFWVVLEVNLSLWQMYGFVALFALSFVLVVSYGRWVGIALLSGLVVILLGLKFYLIPWVENYGGYEGAILLLIFITLLVFKLVQLAQNHMRLNFAADYPLNNGDRICHICSGEGVLNSFQPYLKKSFIQETCYGCNGHGIISEENFAYRIQVLLSQCEKNRLELQKLIDQLESAHHKILQKLAVGEGVLEAEVKQRLQISSESYRQQLQVTHKQVSFYKASEEKMHIMLYNRHVAEELMNSHQQLEDFRQANEKHHETLDFIQMQLGQEAQLNTETDALGIEYDLQAPVVMDEFELIVKKIEDITHKIKAL
ncbi:hypothetical protein BKI52_00625 [marine bacterium AO1-C]|nr:hypothetical protein BKI52_00625 [marine bacterium AO1-C]